MSDQQKLPPLNHCADHCADCGRWVVPGWLWRNYLCPQCVAKWIKRYR